MKAHNPQQMKTAAVADIWQQVIEETQPRPPRPAPLVAAGDALLGPRGMSGMRARNFGSRVERADDFGWKAGE